MNAIWLIGSLSSALGGTPEDSVQKQISAQAHSGFIIPHADDLRDISRSVPVGITLEYSRINLRRNAFERCNCFARVGAYAHYVAFNNPAELGHTMGGGAFFEPLIRYGKPVSFSVRAAAGFAYLTRFYNPVTNPRNTFFSSSLNGWLSLSTATYIQLNQHVQLSLSANYNHISNGGSQQPNRGMNFPTAALGLTYTLNRLPFPDPNSWSKPALDQRLLWRLMPFSSIRTLYATPNRYALRTSNLASGSNSHSGLASEPFSYAGSGYRNREGRLYPGTATT